MRTKLERYGFVTGVVLGVLIGIFTGSVAVWIGIGAALGLAFAHIRPRRNLRAGEGEILPPVRTR